MAASTTRRDARRSMTPTRLKLQDGLVTHSPLYFEDSAEVAYREDDSFAWSSDDYIQLFVGGGRFIANGVFFPISVLDTPPWLLMSSDGRPSRTVLGVKHDAMRHE